MPATTSDAPPKKKAALRWLFSWFLAETVGLRHGLGLGRWLRTPRIARAEALARMLYCKSVNGKRAHGALRCARCAQQMDDSERAAQVWAALRIPHGGHADGPLVSGKC